MNALLSALLGFTVTTIAVMALRPLAVTLDLVDRPGGRKTHHGEVPVVGGLAMFIGVVVGMGMVLPSSALPIGTLNAAFGILVLVGLLDDRFSLSPWLRLPVQISVALILALGAGCRVESLGNAFGVGNIALTGVWINIATVVLVAAAINAFNMLDGMDGLAGTTASVAIASLGYVAWRSGNYEVMAVCAVLVGAIGGFLLFNVPVPGERPFRCFMGDAGSTLLGAAVAWIMVRLTQGSSGSIRAISPVAALWIGGLPLFELFWSFIRRIGRGRSPFEADAEHFHHLLMRAGFSVRGAFAIFLVLTMMLAATGLLLDSLRIPEYWSLLALVATCVAVVRSIHGSGVLLQYLPHQARRLGAAPPSVGQV